MDYEMEYCDCVGRGKDHMPNPNCTVCHGTGDTCTRKAFWDLMDEDGKLEQYIAEGDFDE